MATAVSLTEAKIRELLSGYEGVALSQDEINALVGQLLISQQSVSSQMQTLEQQTIPQLLADLAAGDIRIAELNDTVIPTLQADLAEHDLAIDNLNTVTIPALQADLASTSQNVLDSPQSYYTVTAPTNPDEDNRDLVVGDAWYDPNDNNKPYMWNGVEWTAIAGSGDVADFSLTAQKFKTSSHMIY